MIILERFAYSPVGTFGVITYEGFKAYTVERPWANNRARESCIPEGLYDMEWYDSPRFGPTWALVGDTVSLFPAPGKARSAILIHSANTMDELQGCVALGSDLGTVRGKWAVVNSRNTTDAFLALTRGKPHQMQITSFRP